MTETTEILRLKADGELTQQEIAARVGVSPATVSRVVAASRKDAAPESTDEVRRAVDELLADSDVPEVMKAILTSLARQFDSLVADGTPAAARALPAISTEMRNAVMNLLTWPAS